MSGHRIGGWRLRMMVLVALFVIVVAIVATGRGTSVRRRLITKVEAMWPNHVKYAAVSGLAWFGLATGTAGAKTVQPLPPPPPMTFGINLPAIAYWGSTVPFANLMVGSEWLDSHWTPLDEQYQDKDGNIRSLPASSVALRFVSIPPTTSAGIEVRCSYMGSGNLTLAGGGRVLTSAPGSLRFHVASHRGEPTPPWLVLKDVDPRRPFRDLDCRDTRLAGSARFRPEFLQTVRGYSVVRFMDWQNANVNAPVAWATRHLPTGNRSDQDGVSIEDMMGLAREIGADPWFVVPWNADNEYLTKFARLVRAQLPVGRHVYVEVGNEVWNDGFSVGRQAKSEGLARKLSTQPWEAGARRYAQRVGEVMQLWEAVFAGRDGLIRVLSTQQVRPEIAQTALSFGDTAVHVDALATAPYFGDTYGGTSNTRESVFASLSASIPAALDLAAQNRRIAVAYGKRYLAYEGGEALVLPAQPALRETMQRDPAQYALVQRYLLDWRRNIGDVLCVLTSVSPPGPSGNWGLQAWEDETPAEAPKLRAVRNVMAQR